MYELDPEDFVVNFGCLPPLSEGYVVVWSSGTEHYIAHGPDDWESPITCDRFQARRWAVYRAMGDRLRRVREDLRITLDGAVEVVR